VFRKKRSGSRASREAKQIEGRSIPLRMMIEPLSVKSPFDSPELKYWHRSIICWISNRCIPETDDPEERFSPPESS